MLDRTMDSDRTPTRGIAGPVLIGATMGAGVAILFAHLKRRRTPRVVGGAAVRSVLGEVLRTVALSAANAAVRRIADRLFAPVPVHPTSVRRSGAPAAHDSVASV